MMDPLTMALIMAGLKGVVELTEVIMNAVNKGDEPMTEVERERIRTKHREALALTEQLTALPTPTPQSETAKLALESAVETAKAVIEDLPERICMSCGQEVPDTIPPGPVLEA